MTDEPEDSTGPGSDAARDARIRALLTDLGSGPRGESMPANVAARLEDTLARLVAERGGTEAGPEYGLQDGPQDGQHGSPVTVLSLRRRWIPRATAAAAAVVVLGAGGIAAAHLGVFSSGSPTADGAGSSSEKAGSGPAIAGQPSSPGQSLNPEVAGTAASLPQLTAGSFASDVVVLLREHAGLVTPEEARQAPTDSSTSRPQARPSSRPKSQLATSGCPGPRITDGAVPNPVLYDGQPAVLLVHPERHGRTLVEAWTCPGDRLLAGTTITP